MKDWTQIAAGLRLNIPAPEVTRALDALEAAFRPLVRDIPESVEPAVTFQAEAGEEA